MLINWKDVASNKKTGMPLVFFKGVTVKKLTRINPYASGEEMYEGKLIQTPDFKDVTECHDGIYLVSANNILLEARKDYSEIRVSGAALYQLSGKKVKYLTFKSGDCWPIKLKETALSYLEQQPDPLADFSAEELEKALKARRQNDKRSCR